MIAGRELPRFREYITQKQEQNLQELSTREVVAELHDDVPDDIKRRRLEELSELQRGISADRLGRYVGRETQVLIDDVSDPDIDGATHVGRVPWQADDVDGVTVCTIAS